MESRENVEGSVTGTSSTMLALKAIVAERRAAGATQEKKQPRKKDNLWTRPNKGVAARQAKDDAAWAKLNARTAESVEERLKKKAEIYNKLQRGRTGGMTSAQLDNLLVDFDSQNTVGYESDEESTVPSDVDAQPSTYDPLVEITDEFGRSRQVRRSEVPREYLARAGQETLPGDDDPTVIRGHHISNFPVYEPTAERVAKIMEDTAEDPLNKHYDATNENRAKGAAFYQFSGDAETRQRQMDELLGRRDETIKTREARGARDEVQEGSENELQVVSKAISKRKRGLEERRALLNAKRQKKSEPEVSTSSASPAPKPKVQEGSLDAMDFLAKMSRELGGAG
ncbi:hypothetical protein PIIN_00366 [Serendipita indica DSM 11827]|uniref:Uncharacterized protein n=1 Tax=Serendipita indica (strain DSM 11827) TaxID=1109443 RepID=G4T5T4_SERID|nr:hypothetical protein PIIN_00366 [Serendipita indica DSM 11827]